MTTPSSLNHWNGIPPPNGNDSGEAGGITPRLEILGSAAVYGDPESLLGLFLRAQRRGTDHCLKQWQGSLLSEETGFTFRDFSTSTEQYKTRLFFLFVCYFERRHPQNHHMNVPNLIARGRRRHIPNQYQPIFFEPLERHPTPDG